MHILMLRRLLLVALLFGLVTTARAAPCEQKRFDDHAFTVCTFDSTKSDLRVVWTEHGGAPIRSFSRLKTTLGSAIGRVQFAMNAGMFEESGKPLGLYVERGMIRRPLNRRTGSGNFYMQPNGVFAVNADGSVTVETTSAFVSDRRQPFWATQSGPILLTAKKMNPQIAEDGPSKNIRNGVGVRDKHTALFVISEEPVSFGLLTRFFRDALGCTDAVYLDGYVSSVWIPSIGREDHNADLGPMVVVTRK